MTPRQPLGGIPISRLTDTQLVILAAVSRRDDRGVELPTNIKGEAAKSKHLQPINQEFALLLGFADALARDEQQEG